MKPVKTFEQFRQELNESKAINEGILAAVKNTLKKIGEFFSGAGSFFLNALIKQGKKELPEGVTVYPTQEDIAYAKENGVTINAPKSVKEGVDTSDHWSHLDEAKVELVHPNAEVQNVNNDELLEQLRDTVEGGETGKPLLIWGAPGIGKTAIIEAVAKEYYGPNAKKEYRIIDYDLMTMSPEDFFLPAISGKKDGDITPQSKATRLPDEFLPVYRIDDKEGDARVNGIDGKGGILFLDELARCNIRVQNVCLKLSEGRRLGSYVLGSKWVIIAAANREGDDDTGTYSFSSTLGNRFRQVNYAPKFEDWNKWAKDALDAEGSLIVSPEILAFIRFNQDKYFHNLDPQTVDATGGKNTIYPSPRQWTNAAIQLKIRERRYGKAGKKMKDSEIETIVASLVGKDAASAFIGFLRLMQKIDVNEIKAVYENPGKAPSFAGLSMDEKNALVASVVFFKNKQTLKENEMDNFIQWLIDLKDAPFAIKAMVMIQEVHTDLKKNDHWEDVCKARLFDAYPKLMGGR
jgi:hypothetical protein